MLGLGEEASAEVDRALAEVGLTDVAARRVRGFSAGMRRRLALGRVLLARPSLVLLDEPFAALDAEAVALVDRMLGTWRHGGVTVLVASHATDHLADRADATVRLLGGVVAEVIGQGVSWRPPTGEADTAPAPALEGAG
jgi:ABC-type multidrug transport system ATPase subunit